MLVRVNYTKSEGLTQFNDNINWSARDLECEDRGEFLVAWQRDNIEIYKDYVHFNTLTFFLLDTSN